MKIAKRILLFIGLLLAAILIYYTAVVLNARAKTPAIVQGVLNSGRMKLELHDLTNEQVQALLKVQDQNFYNHQGFDISTPGTGITTISQGLVKFYYFDKFKPGIQKIKQTLIARFAFDPMTPKDTILKLFINEVYLGQHNGKEVKGFENAANAYLNKSFKDLTWDEYLGLVAMIRSPNNLHYIKDKEVNQERVDRIKKLLSGEYVPVDNSDWLYGQKVKL
ncbi:glycosyl transferase family 51 [Adhaeribacter rhizoryzae]|uniref:Glycosyl transferase family 51 n=2 Tax=Adhaeribacter rhizoryzae TaxID=2607907 RepID=A0A5M6DPY9_9BACT|nr:glycosyl transferase family 51 [Adhaeribacter rhizoryzae]